MKTLNQCKLQRGEETLVSWIETRGATVGSLVELLPNDGRGLWTVMEVYNPSMNEINFKEKQKFDRRGFPSLDNSD